MAFYIYSYFTIIMLIATLCLPKNQSLINFNAFKESAESAVLSNSLRF